MLCYYFSASDREMSKDDVAEYERALKDTGVDMGPWEYAKKFVLLERFIFDVENRS